MAFSAPCKRCGLEWAAHSTWDKNIGQCTQKLNYQRIFKGEVSKDVIRDTMLNPTVDPAIEAHQLLSTPPSVAESNKAIIDVVEAHLQSLLVLVRSLGLDPTQFLLRAVERENREEKIAYYAQLQRRIWDNASRAGESKHGLNSSDAARVKQIVEHYSGFDRGVQSYSRFREQAEDADAVQRSKEGKNQVPDE